MTSTTTSTKTNMTTGSMTKNSASLEDYLRSRGVQRRLLMPYVTAGVSPDWLELIDAVIDAGADAIEIGIRSRIRPSTA